MFAGLMSRCTMPLPWATSRAAAICMPSSRIVSISSGFPAIRCLRVLALQQFHGDEGLAFALIDFVDGADIGMVESGCGASLATKTFQGLRIVSYIFWQELQSDKSAQARVFRLIYDAHSAAAELLNNAIVRDGLADHGLIRLSY